VIIENQARWLVENFGLFLDSYLQYFDKMAASFW